MLITLRLLHIVLGAFWVGGVMVLAIFLEPSFRAAGPDGARVMAEIVKRRFPVYMLSSAAIAILSGFGLLWIDTRGFAPGWTGYAAAHGYLGGAATAITAVIIGASLVRPTVARIGVLGASLAQSPGGADRDAGLAELARLRERLKTFGRIVAALAALTIAFMAVARYL